MSRLTEYRLLVLAEAIAVHPTFAVSQINTCDAVLKVASELTLQSKSFKVQQLFYNNICTQQDITIDDADRIWSDVSESVGITIPIYDVLVGGKGSYNRSDQNDRRQFRQDLNRTCNTINTSDYRTGTFYERIVTTNRAAIASWERCMQSAEEAQTIRVGVEIKDHVFDVYVKNRVSGHAVTDVYNFTAHPSWPRPAAKPASASETVTCYYQNSAITFPRQFQDRDVQLVCEKPASAEVELAVEASARMVDASGTVLPENDPSHATMRVTLPSQDTELEQLKSEIQHLVNTLDFLKKDLRTSGTFADPHFYARSTNPQGPNAPEEIHPTATYTSHNLDCDEGYYMIGLSLFTNSDGFIQAQVKCSKLIEKK